MQFVVTRRRHRRDQRACGRRERFFSTRINLFWMPEKTHYPNISFAKPCYFLFDLGNKRQLWTLGVTQYQVYQNFMQPLIFFAAGSFQHTVASLFLYSLFATTLICAALGILHWSICKWDVVSVFFNLRVVSKSPSEISPPIGTVLEFALFSKTGPRFAMHAVQIVWI